MINNNDDIRAVNHRPDVFSNLIPLYYDAIIADPPWHFNVHSERGESKSPQAQYDTMTIDDICALPVGHLAAPNCLLMMWTTAPHLQLAFKVINAWGFTYKTMGTWVKTTTSNKLAFGTGYILRSACEPFLIATIGQPKTCAKNIRNVMMAERRDHSRKPDEQYDMIEAMIPNGRYCELFSRTNRKNWHSWGNETGKFND